MESSLNPYEARVLGILIEKAFTTPDQYPLSLNAATNACNQKSCRRPLTDYSEAEVIITLQGLRMKHLGGASFPAGSRVERWRHSAREHWKLQDPSLAVLAELLLRGPQSAAGLRANANRMVSLPSLDDLQRALTPLETGKLVRLIPAGGGSRVPLYAQTLSEEQNQKALQEEEASRSQSPAPLRSASPAPPGEFQALEARVTNLEAKLRTLLEKLGESL